MDWSHVDYFWITVMFLAAIVTFWRHPFAAENPLVSKWCNAKLLQICSSEEKNAWEFSLLDDQFP